MAAALLTTLYHLLKNATCYQDLGQNHFDQKAKEKHILRPVNRLENLDFEVQIVPKEALEDISFPFRTAGRVSQR